MVPAAFDFLRDLPRRRRSKDQEQDNEREADEEQDLGDPRRGTRDAAKAEHGRDQRDHRKYQSPFEHLTSPSIVQSMTHGTGFESPQNGSSE
jgi:hypothetical protein